MGMEQFVVRGKQKFSSGLGYPSEHVLCQKWSLDKAGT